MFSKREKFNELFYKTICVYETNDSNIRIINRTILVKKKNDQFIYIRNLITLPRNSAIVI